MELLPYFGQWFRNVHEALNYVVEAWWWCEEEKIGCKQTKKWGGAKDFPGASVLANSPGLAKSEVRYQY